MRTTPESVRTSVTAFRSSGVVGLQDRTVVGVVVYAATRGGTVLMLRLVDYCTGGRPWPFRVDEIGGNARDIPAQHDLKGYLAVVGVYLGHQLA